MSLQWTDKIDGTDVIMAKDINAIAHSVIDVENSKVDKITGKGLSTNDFTDELKQKVENSLTEHQDISGKENKILYGYYDYANKYFVDSDSQPIENVENQLYYDVQLNVLYLYRSGKFNPVSKTLFGFFESPDFIGSDGTPLVKTTECLYIDTHTNFAYIWNGTKFVKIGISKTSELSNDSGFITEANLTPNIEYTITSNSTLQTDTIYTVGTQTVLSFSLPHVLEVEGKFIQVDFISGATPTNLTISSTMSGMTDFNLTPEKNTMYSLFMNQCQFSDGSFGWCINYSENTYTPSSSDSNTPLS